MSIRNSHYSSILSNMLYEAKSSIEYDWGSCFDFFERFSDFFSAKNSVQPFTIEFCTIRIFSSSVFAKVSNFLRPKIIA
nr:MAG TPA: hypothetical protein [Caudoviricetes sp.]